MLHLVLVVVWCGGVALLVMRVVMQVSPITGISGVTTTRVTGSPANTCHDGVHLDL